MYLSGFVLGKPHSPVSNLQTLIFQTPSYLMECLGLKGDKETLSKMYESMRSEWTAPTTCDHKMEISSHSEPHCGVRHATRLIRGTTERLLSSPRDENPLKEVWASQSRGSECLQAEVGKDSCWVCHLEQVSTCQLVFIFTLGDFNLDYRSEIKYVFFKMELVYVFKHA